MPRPRRFRRTFPSVSRGGSACAASRLGRLGQALFEGFHLRCRERARSADGGAPCPGSDRSRPGAASTRSARSCSNIRRIWRVRPSCRMTESQAFPLAQRPGRLGVPRGPRSEIALVVETRSMTQGRVRAPSRNTPRRSRSRSLSPGTPETLTLYSLEHPLEGWSHRRASSPSSVEQEQPFRLDVETPTGLTPRRRLPGSRSITVSRLLGVRHGRHVAARFVQENVGPRALPERARGPGCRPA